MKSADEINVGDYFLFNYRVSYPNVFKITKLKWHNNGFVCNALITYIDVDKKLTTIHTEIRDFKHMIELVPKVVGIITIKE
jgi:hypothetical protein